MKEYTIREYINWFSGKKKGIAIILLALTVGFGVLAGVFLNRPASRAFGGLFVFLTVAAGIAAIAMLASTLVKISPNKAALKRLEERGLSEQAEQALNAPDVQSLKNDRFRMDDRFLFGREMGLAAAWDDVRWCYISRVIRNRGLSTTHSLIICTADKKSHVLIYPPRRDDEMQELMNSFAQYNPNILLGYSMENQNAYRQSVKES